MWHPSVKVTIIPKSLQMISCQGMLLDAHEEIISSFMYASNDECSRRDIWKDIADLSVNQQVMGKAWSVIGDFNQTLSPLDHSTPINPNVDLPTRLFRECLLDAELSDLTYRGCSFTWWNKQISNP